jgi:enamine deaminase RidA (YjgF/YER057c/UK114 family)
MACFGAVRQRYLGDHRPASTLIIAQALANPEYLVEVEVIAAR